MTHEKEIKRIQQEVVRVRRRRRQKREIPFFFQVLCCSVGAAVILLAAALGVTLYFSISTFREQTESHLRSTAEALADSKMVRQAFRDGVCSEEMIDYLDNMVQQNEDLDMLTIAGMDSIRLYHVVHERIGGEFVGGDQGDVLEGKSYFSDAVGTMGLQHRYLTPVYDEDGKTQLGFVMTSATMEQMSALRGSIFAAYAKIALIMLLALALISGVLTAFIRRLFLGATPRQFAEAYQMQNQLLNSLEEGIISADRQGRIRFVNEAAERMLGKTFEEMEDQPPSHFLTADGGSDLLTLTGENIQSSISSILVNCIHKTPKQQGTVLVLKDKSEAMREAEQLNGCRCMITALRANTHEFMNKLQVLSGLMQMGRIQEAQQYIGSVSEMQTKVVSPIVRNILNQNVAALLLGKMKNAQELDIQMELLSNSRLPEHSAFLCTANLVTVIGNLLENAIEAVGARTDGFTRSIEVQITEDESGLLLQVSDTGIGIRPELIDRITDYGFSTKAETGRGVGMALIQDIVERRNGTMEIDSEPGIGTTFTLIFQQKR